MRRTQPHMVTASKIDAVQYFCRSLAITCGFNEWAERTGMRTAKS